MATAAPPALPRKKLDLQPNAVDWLLSATSLLLFAAALTALWRGRDEWGELPPFVWPHVGTILVALGLTPVMLLRRRGDRLHRRLGWVWAAAMVLTAGASFGIRGINEGGLSFIHILSAIVIVQVPMIVWAARTHRVAMHRSIVRWMIAGALIVAGAFTFLPDRVLGDWLLG
jgi:uncharacterized membrane protein